MGFKKQTCYPLFCIPVSSEQQKDKGEYASKPNTTQIDHLRIGAGKGWFSARTEEVCRQNGRKFPLQGGKSLGEQAQVRTKRVIQINPNHWEAVHNLILQPVYEKEIAVIKISELYRNNSNGM